LIKAGAMLVEGVEDIVSAVEAQLEPHARRPAPAARSRREASSGVRPSPAQGDAPPLTTEEAVLVEQLTREPSHMDELAVRSGRPVQQVAALLVSLEIKGRVRQLPGNYYCAS
jgi:DNA processing protein